jgi:hypothetical protein
VFFVAGGATMGFGRCGGEQEGGEKQEAVHSWRRDGMIRDERWCFLRLRPVLKKFVRFEAAKRSDNRVGWVFIGG